MAANAAFSHDTRKDNLERLATDEFDILVIGGGITGAGIARRAALMGYRVALVEKGDFASGTSSHSSKIVHGGFRYLATHDYELVYQASRQRRKLIQRAPHLIWSLPFVVPIYRNSPYSLTKIAAGVLLYESLATFRTIKHSELLPAPETLADEPLLNPNGLRGAARYYDCGTDDARLTLAVIRDAHLYGATAANYVEATSFMRAGERIYGAHVKDRLTGEEHEICARIVISAVGPWTDLLLNRRRRDQRWLRPTKGVHIIVPRHRASTTASLTFTARDDRFLFLIPYGAHTIIGTTDTEYGGSPEDAHADANDVAYILDAARLAFPAANLNADDIISTYAGVRPLIRDDAQSNYANSREHRIEEIVPGLVAIAGGKLTTFRSMAKETVKFVSESLDDHRVTALRNLQPDGTPFPGGDVDDWDEFREQMTGTLTRVNELPGDVAQHLVSTYGSEVASVANLASLHPSLAERVTPELPVIRAQVIHALKKEMAMTLSDVLDRRLHLLYFAPDQGLGAAPAVADLMGDELGWTDAERARQVKQYKSEILKSRRWRVG